MHFNCCQKCNKKLHLDEMYGNVFPASCNVSPLEHHKSQFKCINEFKMNHCDKVSFHRPAVHTLHTMHWHENKRHRQSHLAAKMHAKMGNVNNLHNWNMAERSDLMLKSRIHLNQVSNDKVINGYFFNFEDDLYIKIIFVNTSSIDFLMRMPSVRYICSFVDIFFFFLFS